MIRTCTTLAAGLLLAAAGTQADTAKYVSTVKPFARGDILVAATIMDNPTTTTAARAGSSSTTRTWSRRASFI